MPTPTPALTRAHVDRRRRAQQNAATARAEAILARLPSAIAEARATFGPLDFWLFGSLSGTGAPVHAASDIDLAVRGLPAARYFELAAQLAEALGADVDLVALETASQSLIARIESEGVTL